jgi:hypothetical protein
MRNRGRNQQGQRNVREVRKVIAGKRDRSNADQSELANGPGEKEQGEQMSAPLELFYMHGGVKGAAIG